MLSALFLIAAAQATDPLAEARAGKIQCITPDTAKKSCQAIANYVVRPDGSFDTTVTLVIAPSPLITMATKSIGAIEGALVCSVVKKADYAAAKYTVDGKPADEATSNAISAQVLATISALDGKKACSTDRADGAVMIEEVTLDGVARPDMTQRFIWVKPSEGYKVG